ncbi:MAG: hypothetical protein AAGC54_06470 [Cyanobacteria bacterium P01_F01_bin.4]
MSDVLNNEYADAPISYHLRHSSKHLSRAAWHHTKAKHTERS